MDSAQLMTSYSQCCFILSVWHVALSFIFRPCSEVRIINFLIGFSVLLITTASECFTGFKLISTKPQWGMRYYLCFTDGELTEIKVRKISPNLDAHLRHKIGFLEPFRSYCMYWVQKTAPSTSASDVFWLCLCIYPSISSV